uniref:DGKD n=1 Tax=Macrostomum lignano TaxID=282301 RepID=A0A1I8FHA1_9PLAT
GAVDCVLDCGENRDAEGRSRGVAAQLEKVRPKHLGQGRDKKPGGASGYPSVFLAAQWCNAPIMPLSLPAAMRSAAHNADDAKSPAGSAGLHRQSHFFSHAVAPPMASREEVGCNRGARWRNLWPPDGKLESRLTTKDLELYKKHFNFKGDSYERLCLNRDQFVQALSIILNKGTDEEEEGSVSWDQLAQHMLLQFYERDDKVKSTQLPQWRDIRMIPGTAQEGDVIQREGTISLMSTDLEVSRTVRTSSDACKTARQPVW